MNSNAQDWHVVEQDDVIIARLYGPRHPDGGDYAPIAESANKSLLRKIALAMNCHDELLAALKEALATIKVFHGKPAWDIYERCAPEMQRFKAAIAKAEGVTR